MSNGAVSSYKGRLRREHGAASPFAKTWTVRRPGHFQVGTISSARTDAWSEHSIDKARVVEFYKRSEELDLLQKELIAYYPQVRGPYARDEHVRALFEPLRDVWHRETEVLSAHSDIVLNENYQKIIGLGPQAVPWILDDLRQTSAPWFWALRMITREDPVDTRDRGRVRRMVDAWLEWGRRNNIE